MGSLAGFNTGGTHNTVLIDVDNATGFTITVAASATPQVVTDALFTEKKNSTNGGITYAAGVATVATPAGFGRYLVSATASDALGILSTFHFVQVYAKEAGVNAAAKGSKSLRTEGGTAVRGSTGCAVAIVDLSAIGDTVEMRLGVQTNGNAILIRSASLQMIKIGEV
jgi:hypothetical protein